MRPAVHFHIRAGARKPESAIGPGKIALLEAIAASGSITAAARALGMSYRRAWLLVDEVNRALVQPAITASAGGARGGGARLTPTGAELCRRYRTLERQIDAAVARELRGLLRGGSRTGATP